jgi:hypothetical protein
LSSEEIEDVVSSVRRLVSNEQRPRTQSRDLNADRLILTPALRVISDTSPLSPLMLQTPLGEAPVEPQPEASVAPGPMAEQRVAEADEAIEADWEDELWVEPEDTSLAEIALGAEEAVVLPPEEEGVASAAFAPDVGEAPEPWAQGENDWARDEPIPFVPLRRRAENLAARLAAGAAKDLGRTEPEATPEPVTEPVPEEEPARFGARSESIAEEVIARQRMPTEIIDADGVPLAVLDEAALQEIVRLMIREELRGALGERITRSVRKLVRTEINRALIARDLD